MQYKVVWTIDIEANSPEEAAKEALAIQRDNGSEAVAFEVINSNSGKLIKHVDLLNPDDESLAEIIYGD